MKYLLRPDQNSTSLSILRENLISKVDSPCLLERFFFTCNKEGQGRFFNREVDSFSFRYTCHKPLATLLIFSWQKFLRPNPLFPPVQNFTAKNRHATSTELIHPHSLHTQLERWKFKAESFFSRIANL